VTVERRALPAGDYGAVTKGNVIAVVERKTLANLASSLSDGILAFQMQRLPRLTAPPLWSKAITQIFFAPSQVAVPGSPTCSVA